MMLFAAAAVCAYFIKGLCGFANTLIFGSILSFGVDNVNISPVDLILGCPSNLILTWKNRKDLDWRVWMPLAGLVLLGNIPGIFLLKNVDARLVKLLFGVAVVGIGLEMLVRERGAGKEMTAGTEAGQRTGSTEGGASGKQKSSRIVLLLIGLISGLLCGLYGVGALLAAYMSRVTDSSRAFKANICAVFITENLFRIVVYTLTGILTLSVLKQAIMLVPAMLLGLLLGMKSAGRLKEQLVKTIVIFMLLLSGVSLIVLNL